MAATIKNRYAVVTGASSGIGFELARQCLANGFDLLICAETEDIAEAAERLSGHVRPVQADLATYEGVQQLYDMIRGCGRPIDALVLNAGVGVGGPFVATELDAELKMIALNCMHVIHLAKLVLPEMIDRGQGRMLITGSVVSTTPNPWQAVYAATMAFVMSFGEALREELRDTGVSVTVLQPGATDTNFFRRANLMNTKVGQSKKDDPALVAKQGFDAMMAGKDSVLAGSLKSRFGGLMNEVLPETIKARGAGRTTKPLG